MTLLNIHLLHLRKMIMCWKIIWKLICQSWAWNESCLIFTFVLSISLYNLPWMISNVMFLKTKLFLNLYRFILNVNLTIWKVKIVFSIYWYCILTSWKIPAQLSKSVWHFKNVNQCALLSNIMNRLPKHSVSFWIILKRKSTVWMTIFSWNL